MKVFIQPVGLYSRAMVRVANALQRRAPKHVSFVRSLDEADLVIGHVIGEGSLKELPATKSRVLIQYCLKSAGLNYDRWLEEWHQSVLVWSYFDLVEEVGENGFPFYHAPLGIEASTFTNDGSPMRDIGIMTSGYTTGPDSEAILEVALAANQMGLRVVHLGPPVVEGMKIRTPRWQSVYNVSDPDLVGLYQRSEWVSGLRHVEGFELPVLEGLLCGARPIVFDRPDMTQWYEGHAVFVPECSGPSLVEELTQVLRYHPKEVTEEERAGLVERFGWDTIAKGFWERL